MEHFGPIVEGSNRTFMELKFIINIQSKYRLLF